MKILIIMAGFFPGKKYGGPPVSVDNFCTLMKDNECYVVTHNHDLNEKDTYNDIPSGKWINRTNCKVMYLSDIDYCKKRFETIIDEIKPDILYLQGLFQECVLPCLQLAKKNGIKVMLAPRGELCKGAFKKKYKKIPYILYLKASKLLSNVVYQSTSQEESISIEKILGVNKKYVYLLTNIPSIPSVEYKRNKKITGVGNFVFISRIHPKKNLLSAIQFFRNINGDVRFDIYGPIEDESYWYECKKTIKSLPSNIKVRYCGTISHENVHETFSKYDAFVFPTFSENYGHVIAESLLVGTPVIISDKTPWNSLNDIYPGAVVKLNDDSGFSASIQRIVELNEDDFDKITHDILAFATEKLDLNTVKENYNRILYSEIS